VPGVDPDADVNLAVEKLAEHHADLLPGIDDHEPGRLLELHPAQGGADLVVEVAGRSTRSVTGGVHLLGAGGEDVAILGGGERAKLEALARACRAVAE